MTQFDDDWISGNIKCHSQFENVTLPGYCQSVWDRYLCWPPTQAGKIAKQICPFPGRSGGLRFAHRTCRGDGVWEGKVVGGIASNNDSFGWTNFSHCFREPGMEDILQVLNSQEEGTKLKLQMAESTRGFEMIGLAISMVSIVLAIFTFCHFRNLWSNRTRIHKNLFFALGIQVLLRLIFYIDQFVSSSSPFPTAASSSPRKIKNNSSYVCESFYLLFECAKTSMFLWMFVDGLYLHNVITVAIVSERLSQTFYYCIGWGSPIFFTVVWALAASEEFQRVACSWGINSTPYFLMLEVPRCSIIVLNFLILLNIIRVLATKMRDTSSPEIQQVRKALRTSVILLPLLGTTNYLRMIYSPVNKSMSHFITWSYLNAFLTSFQGFFCALICCFLNGEVQLSIKMCLRQRRGNDDSNNSGEFTLATIQKFQQKIPGEQNDDDPKSDETTGVDPFKENWSEVELSSHNNVDIEHIEIPTEYIIKQSRSSSTCNKWSHSSASGSASASATSEKNPMVLETPAPVLGEQLNHVVVK